MSDPPELYHKVELYHLAELDPSSIALPQTDFRCSKPMARVTPNVSNLEVSPSSLYAQNIGVCSISTSLETLVKKEQEREEFPEGVSPNPITRGESREESPTPISKGSAPPKLQQCLGQRPKTSRGRKVENPRSSQ